jgi:hypothetical protein
MNSLTSSPRSLNRPIGLWGDCGCILHRYGLEVAYNADITMNLGSGITDHSLETIKGSGPGGSVEIPLYFQEDGTVTGEGQATEANSQLLSGIAPCPAPATAQMVLRLAASGNITGNGAPRSFFGSEDEGDPVLHLKLSNSGPVAVTGVDCKGAYSHSGIPQGAHPIEFELPGVVGAEKDLVISPPALPHITTTGSWHIKVKLVELEQQQPQ